MYGILLRTFGSLYHNEFLLRRSTELSFSAFKAIALLFQSNCFFWYSKHWVIELIVVCSLPCFLRCSEPLLIPKYKKIHRVLCICYLSVYLTRGVFLFHIINRMIVINFATTTHMRFGTILALLFRPILTRNLFTKTNSILTQLRI